MEHNQFLGLGNLLCNCTTCKFVLKNISNNNGELPSGARLNRYDLQTISGCVLFNTSNLHSFQKRNRKMNWFTRWRSSRSLEFTAHVPCKPAYYKWISAV